jgi:hypothetical protein
MWVWIRISNPNPYSPKILDPDLVVLTDLVVCPTELRFLSSHFLLHFSILLLSLGREQSEKHLYVLKMNELEQIDDVIMKKF